MTSTDANEFKKDWYVVHYDQDLEKGFDSKEEAEAYIREVKEDELKQFFVSKVDDSKREVANPEWVPGLFQPMTRAEMEAEQKNPTERRFAIVRMNKDPQRQLPRYMVVFDTERERVLGAWLRHHTEKEAYKAYIDDRHSECFGDEKKDEKLASCVHRVFAQVAVDKIDPSLAVLLQPNAGPRIPIAADGDCFTPLPRDDYTFVKDCLDIETGNVDKSRDVLKRYFDIACIPREMCLWKEYEIVRKDHLREWNEKQRAHDV